LTGGSRKIEFVHQSFTGDLSGRRRIVTSSRSTTTTITIFCSAQVLAQMGGLMFAALLPEFIEGWQLTHSQAGWLSGIFFGAYALSVPVLVTLTDRVPARHVYISALMVTIASHLGMVFLADGFWSALIWRVAAGVGWAGTYMVGLRAMSDELSGAAQSRAVSFNAASIGAAGALSFVVAGLVGGRWGFEAAFAVAAVSSSIAFVIAVTLFPSGTKPTPAPGQSLLDFRPVLRNRSAMAYSLGYCVHTWEMFVVRSWGVTFLTFAMVHNEVVPLILLPTVIAMVMEVSGTAASVAGNELAMRFGRQRWILGVMTACMVCACFIGFSAGLGYLAAGAACLVYNMLIYADSAALTAGTVGSAEPERKGATLALHSLLGYSGGFVGPLVMGLLLDDLGGETVANWGLGFSHLALVMVIGPAAMLLLKPARLLGDK
jgi:predicted MFS family arabinose efflux permease